MATGVEETPSPVARSPWYGKVFECWRNRNRVSPSKVELADCDFFIVAPRRTLRVLRPTLKSGWYYESTIERPESINDNFFTRWSRRPHPSGNCRCSFRQSAGALSTDEERIISAELNRIRTSLCAAEGNTRSIEELEQRVTVNLQKLQDDGPAASRASEMTSTERSAKHLIIKDLERYINTLLEEILDETVKHVAETEKNAARRFEARAENFSEDPRHTDRVDGEISGRRDASGSADINSSFSEETRDRWNPRTHHTAENGCDKRFNGVPASEGYVNPAFVGSTDGLASLELDRAARKHTDLYLGMTTNTESIAPEQLDCVDSGINSVETIEFQPDQEPSFEQSLLRIIDEKLGRGPPTSNSGDEDSSERNTRGAISGMEENREIDSFEISARPRDSDRGMIERLEDAVNTEAGFEKLRLEFRDSVKDAILNGDVLPKLRTETDARLTTEDVAIELEDCRKEWPDEAASLSRGSIQRNLHDSVTLRRNRKPTIVFLHGFGSSAEVFEHQLRYFSSLGYPCIAPDMLGHGMSSAPGRSRDYHFAKLLKDLDTVLHHYAFKPGEKCVLVAHNYGCSFATALAYKYDSNIHQLILISGGGPTSLAPPSTESAGHCCLRAILAPLLMCGLHRDILYSARGRQHPYCGQESSEQWPSHMKYVLDGMIWPEGDYVFHRRICTPTLLVHGLRDNKVSLVQECQMERTMMKAFLEAIPMAGHSPMTECPQQLNHMIHCFIDLWKNKKWQQ